MKMAKVAVEMAVKNGISLGMDANGYHIRNPQTREIVAVSLRPTGQSAVNMMKRFLKQPDSARHWR